MALLIFLFLSAFPMTARSEPQPWWLRTDLGPHDSNTALAQMWTPTLDDAIGAGGLRLSGTGEGAGVRTPTIAIDHGIRTVGDGGEMDDWDAFDGRVRLAKRKATKPLPVAVTHLPPDVIQRVVRDNFGRFEVCYEAALRTNASLQGRVAVKFVIDRAGTVAFAADSGSDMPDDGVVMCVVRAFDTLAFPEAADGLVTVIYALAFSPKSKAEP